MLFSDYRLKDLYNIIVDINICLNNAKRLKREDNEIIESIKREAYFQNHWYHLRFIMIIQLAKLFQNSGSQKITFQKLLNRLANEGYDTSLMDKLQKNSIDGDSNLIKTKKDILEIKIEISELFNNHSDLILKLENSRNKVFAHSDPDIKVEYLNLNDLEKLTRLSNISFNKINGGFNNVTTFFEITSSWNIGFILTDMARGRGMRV